MKKIILIIAGAIFALVFILGALLYVDPFNWHLADRFGGDYNAALDAIPPDSDAYVGVNLLNANLEQWETLADALPSGGGDSVFDLLREEVETAVNLPTNLTFDDFKPWLGQYLSGAIVDIELGESGEIVGFEWVIIAESRDNAAADQFLADLGGGAAARRDGRLVFIGSTSETVGRAIETQNGESLADAVGYAEAIAQLPSDRFLTAFIQSDDMRRLLDQFPQRLMGVGAADLLPNALQGTAVSLKPTTDGVQIDIAAIYDQETLTAVQKQLISAVGEQGAAAQRLPADTLAYFPGQPASLTWGGLRETFINALGQADFDESMELFGEDFGLNPDADLFPLLDGETAVALLPAGAMDDPFAVAALMQSGAPEAMDAVLEHFQTTTTSSGLGTITAVGEEGDTAVYDFETFLIPDLKVSYGFMEDYFLLGNNPHAQLTLPAADTLAAQSRYQNVWGAFPDEMTPGFYINAPALAAGLAQAGMLDEGDTAVFQAIPAVVGAADSKGNIVLQRIIIFVDGE